MFNVKVTLQLGIHFFQLPYTIDHKYLLLRKTSCSFLINHWCVNCGDPVLAIYFLLGVHSLES